MTDTTNTTVDTEEANKRLVEDLFDLWTNPDRAGERPYPPMFEIQLGKWHGHSDGTMTAIVSAVVDPEDGEITLQGVIRNGGDHFHTLMWRPLDRTTHATLAVHAGEECAFYTVRPDGIQLDDTAGVDEDQLARGLGVVNVEAWSKMAATMYPVLCAYAQQPHLRGPKLVHASIDAEGERDCDPLDQLATMIRDGNAARGFNPLEDVHRSLLLVVSEITEALEAVRMIKDPTKTTAQLYAMHWMDGLKPNGPADELADVLIRLLDLMKALGIPIGETVRRKLAYNDTRIKMHGKQF